LYVDFCFVFLEFRGCALFKGACYNAEIAVFIVQAVLLISSAGLERNIATFPMLLIINRRWCLWFSVVLGKSHYVLYNLVAAMQPRMLVTFDEELRPLPVSVRVGQVR
jgi:hypothetical protein